jgi:L-ascorbate metabolism protein UlaG (beta-lactamase superfamily)
MDTQFYGANCITLNTKHESLVIDDNLADLGGKSILKAGDIAIFTGAHGEVANNAKIKIDQPGEYEVAGVTIHGIAARSHIDVEGQKNATIYKVTFEDMRILITGHIYPELSEDQLEAIGTVDVMFVPVGGNGYTLDAIGALKLVKKVEPKLVIPTHYANNSLNYPVPQRTLDEALQVLVMEQKETTSKIKLKGIDLGETTQLLVLKES